MVRFSVLALAASFILGLIGVDDARADRRIAFVIGNSKYEKANPLPNARRDASVMSDRLRELGFEVTELFDGDAFALNRAADRFAGQARGADLALFYFAGHGVQLFDQNYLLATDADPARIARVEDLGLDFGKFMGALRKSAPVRQALLVDACRENPFSFAETVKLLELVRSGPGAAVAANNTGGRRGLANVALAGGGAGTGNAETLIFFAAQPGEVSFDGVGQNSFYVEGLKAGLSRPDRPLSEIFREVSAYVRTVSNGQQVPQVVSDWTADVTLGASKAERVEYGVSSFTATGNKALTPAERNLVIRAATGFSKFNGDFIAKASLGDLPHHELTEAEQKRAKELGNTTSFKIAVDLDRDGRDEVIHVFFRQFGFVFAIEVAGVVAEMSSCVGNEQVQSIEVALKDINGDRRPEVWVAFETEQTSGWGTFCILEYVGLPDIAQRKRGDTGNVYVGYDPFRTLLRADSGWNVSVATDNTIKACGGTGCHTSWTFSFDGERFRYLDNQGDKPSASAALPFKNERERAANLFAGLSRASAAVTPQSWQATQTKDNVTYATARIGSRTELAIECLRPNPTGPFFEALVIRDKPPANARGEPEVSIEPTLAYGESASVAPLLTDGKPCVLDGIAAGDNQEIRLTFPENQAACVDALARVGVATIPVLRGKDALLQVRMTGAAPAIDAARRVCRGERQASLDRSPPAQVTPPSAVQSALQPRAQQFLEDYMRRSEGQLAEILNYTRDVMAAEVNYYGKRTSNQQIVDEKRRYVARWPQRSYKLKPETARIACEDARQACRIVGEMEYRTANPAEARVSSGFASYDLTVDFSRGAPKIVEENGKTIRRN